MSRWLAKYKNSCESSKGDEYKTLFDKCAAAINEFWSNELHCYMKDKCPEIAGQIDYSESKLNQLWGNAHLSDYRQELVRFYRLHQAVKDLYGREERTGE